MDYRYQCPHCETQTRFPLSTPFWAESLQGSATWYKGPREKFEAGSYLMGQFQIGVGNTDTSRTGRIVACTSICPECKGPSILVLLATSEAENVLKSNVNLPGHLSDRTAPVRLVEILPRSELGARLRDVPPKIANEFPVAQELAAQSRAPATIITNCGSCLEEALKEIEKRALDEGWLAEPLKKGLKLVARIDALKDAGAITRDLAEWAHSRRLDRNEGVHELEASIERAREYVQFMEYLLEATFAMPARLRRLRGV